MATGGQLEQPPEERINSSAIPSARLLTAVSTSSKARPLSEKRLFVTNLAPQVTEHDLLRLFQPFGTLRKLDLVFHRSGPQKGRPKGYAFVELTQKDDAERARTSLDGRSFRGRDVRVSYATMIEEDSPSTGPQRRKRTEDIARPTTLSLVKNLKCNDSTDARIAAMEAKLLALRRRTQPDSSPASSSPPSSSASSLPPQHPSLPAKPPL